MSYNPNAGSGGLAITDIQALSLINEVKNNPWGSLVRPITDLVTGALWYRDIGTPTSKCSFTTASGEGITYPHEPTLRLVTASANDGFYQRFTYADEPRIKSGVRVSFVCDVYNATAGTLTVELKDSTAAVVASASTTTTGAKVTLTGNSSGVPAGTYLDLRCYHSAGTATFYVNPCVNVGAYGLWIPAPRPVRYVANVASVSTGTDPGGASFTDKVVNTQTSNLAWKAVVAVRYTDSTTAGADFRVRPNGFTDASTLNSVGVNPATGVTARLIFEVLMDDAQTFEFRTSAGAGDTETVDFGVVGYWEYA